MSKIKQITINLPLATKTYTVGYDGVSEIEDANIEYSDSIHWYYRIKDSEGRLIAEIINSPVEVEYERN
ncbi:hypothetical protein [Heyndrickxia sporothermodurans]|uniref:hypothetical protein n=1 Tax=Heyndrickxia sporothermodurans TaxID=46224 RepID=UPI002E1BB48A|nr:hypothetical protein [Heyndrickxia sporothermodurans]MED3697392.1 hypothetical protein [Heyndrickxia sporothermodurans]